MPRKASKHVQNYLSLQNTNQNPSKLLFYPQMDGCDF